MRQEAINRNQKPEIIRAMRLEAKLAAMKARADALELENVNLRGTNARLSDNITSKCNYISTMWAALGSVHGAVEAMRSYNLPKPDKTGS